MDTLRFVTCGSANNGKSALITSLQSTCPALANAPALPEPATRFEVSLRHFTTQQRSFVVADTPGDAQHTRNMASGATSASLALVVVDACEGLQSQGRLHSRILAMMGITHVVLAVNKMDLAGFDEAAFGAIVAEYGRFSSALGFASVQAIPTAALGGDNVVRMSPHMPWYSGPTLLQYLSTVDTQGPPPETDEVLRELQAPAEMADQFEAQLLWVHAHALAPGRQYLLQMAGQEVGVSITDIKYREDVNRGAHLAAKVLEQNEMAVVSLSTNAPLPFAPKASDTALRRFALVDTLTQETVGMGSLQLVLRSASNVYWQRLELNKTARANLKLQTPRCIWFTGLSGSGKSTLANLLEKRLYAEGRHTYLLDGDNVRQGLNRNLGFSEADRVENIRRVAEVARLMVDAGLVVLVSFISPFAAERAMARSLFARGEFVEVFVDSPLAMCERRDTKGLYAKARKGELKDFTGIDSPYEAPTHPDVHLRTAEFWPDECVEQLLLSLEPALCC